jgi:hypothetical protein
MSSNTNFDSTPSRPLEPTYDLTDYDVGTEFAVFGKYYLKQKEGLTLYSMHIWSKAEARSSKPLRAADNYSAFPLIKTSP